MSVVRPHGHEAIRPGASVLVGKDHRVLNRRCAASARLAHEDRKIGELPTVLPRVKNRRHRLRHERLRVRGTTVTLTGRWRRAGGFRAERHVALNRQRVAARGDSSKRHGIVGRGLTSRQQQVLRILAVDPEHQRRRFTPGFSPRAACATGTHYRDRFSGRRGVEGLRIGVHPRRRVGDSRPDGDDEGEDSRRHRCTLADISV
jgi:hypothetical protein